MAVRSGGLGWAVGEGLCSEKVMLERRPQGDMEPACHPGRGESVSSAPKQRRGESVSRAPEKGSPGMWKLAHPSEGA